LKELSHARPFDVIHLECGYVGQYLEFLPKGRRFLLDQNVEYWVLDRYRAVSRNPVLRLALWLESRRLRRSEQFAWRMADAVGTVSEVDRDEVRRVDGTKAVWVVPNGTEIRLGSRPAAPADSRQIIFTGNFRYFANVDAALYLCREIFPAIRACFPEAELLIIGSQADKKLAKLGGCPGVTVKGWVPDLAPYVDSAAVYVCPLRTGSGTKLKVLEAMGAQKAIVSTSVGVEGLRVKDGEHLLVADDPQAFASSVCRILGDLELRSRLGRSACNLACEHYSWKEIAGKLREAYASMIRSQESTEAARSELRV
jgi:glycosyltransferase involved in cell wall biosynthesis